MGERTRQEVGASRAEITSALEAVAADNAQLVAWGNIAFEQCDRALLQTVREEFDGNRALIDMDMQEDIPAHVEARIADVRDYFREQFNEGARRVEQHAREHCEQFAAAPDNARAHAENSCERLEEGFVRERDRAAVAELVLADRAAQLREEGRRELISIEVLNDCWTQCGFLRVSMNSLLWLWLLREIVAENNKEECETVFCATSIKVPIVPYLNESCMSLSGMSSGPHGQTSAPAHEFSSGNMSNEVCYKSCSLHKSRYSALQRDHRVYFDSYWRSPADSALCNVTCPGNYSQFCGGDSWYTFHLMYLWVPPVEAI